MVDYFIDNQVFYHHGKFSHIVKVVLSETFLIGIAILKTFDYICPCSNDVVL